MTGQLASGFALSLHLIVLSQARETQAALSSIKMAFVDKLASLAAASLQHLDGRLLLPLRSIRKCVRKRCALFCAGSCLWNTGAAPAAPPALDDLSKFRQEVHFVCLRSNAVAVR